jgi:hypothetical protein
MSVRSRLINKEQAAMIPYDFTCVYIGLFDFGLVLAPDSIESLGTRKSIREAPDLPQYNKEQSLLINDAAGPQGMLAVQLARRAGVGHITATCKAEDMQYVRTLGAHEVLDCHTSPGNLIGWERRKFDGAFDSVGGECLRDIHRALRDGGRLISSICIPNAYTADEPDRDIKQLFSIPRPQLKPLVWLTYMLNRGLQAPRYNPDLVFEFDEWEKARVKLSTLGPIGKIALRLPARKPGPLIRYLAQSGLDEDEDRGSEYVSSSPEPEVAPSATAIPGAYPNDIFDEHTQDEDLGREGGRTVLPIPSSPPSIPSLSSLPPLRPLDTPPGACFGGLLGTVIQEARAGTPKPAGASRAGTPVAEPAPQAGTPFTPRKRKKLAQIEKYNQRLRGELDAGLVVENQDGGEESEEGEVEQEEGEEEEMDLEEKAERILNDLPDMLDIFINEEIRDEMDSTTSLDELESLIQRGVLTAFVWPGDET